MIYFTFAAQLLIDFEFQFSTTAQHCIVIVQAVKIIGGNKIVELKYTLELCLLAIMVKHGRDSDLYLLDFLIFIPPPLWRSGMCATLTGLPSMHRNIRTDS